jgi:hypothetical protein
MSFDLAFWHETQPSDAERAYEIYDRLTDGETGVAESHPAVDEFYREVLSVYADITEENAEESPWASSPYRNDECVVAAIAWSRHEEVGAALIELADKHGLTAYDPQDRVVHHPTGR